MGKFNYWFGMIWGAFWFALLKWSSPNVSVWAIFGVFVFLGVFDCGWDFYVKRRTQKEHHADE